MPHVPGQTLACRRDGTVAASMLHALAAAPGGVRATTELIYLTQKPGRWDDPAVTRQRALCRAASVLRELEASGHVERAGEVPGHWQQAPVQKWRITPKGRDQLAWWADAPRRDAQQAIEQYQQAVRKLAQQTALDEAKVKYAGRRVPVDERRRVSQELRNAGCTLQSIADVFGVTRELTRQDTTPDWKDRLPPAVPRRRRPGARGRVTMTGRQGRWPKQISVMNKSGPLAGLFTVTFTEW